MIQDFFDALAKGTEELKKKFCDLIDSRDTLVAEKEEWKKEAEAVSNNYDRLIKTHDVLTEENGKLKNDLELNGRIRSGQASMIKSLNDRIENLSGLHPVYGKSPLEMVIDERDVLAAEVKVLKERLRNSDSCVDVLAAEVRALKERKVLNEYRHQPVAANLVDWRYAFVQREVIGAVKQVTYADLVVENQSLKSKLDKIEAIAKGAFEDLSKLQKEKDGGFFLDAMKANVLVNENRQLAAQRDALDRKVSYAEEVIGQRNSMIAGLQRQIGDLEAAKDIHEMYGRPEMTNWPSIICRYSFVHDKESHVEGIGEKTIHLSGHPIKIVVDTRISAGMIIIK